MLDCWKPGTMVQMSRGREALGTTVPCNAANVLNYRGQTILLLVLVELGECVDRTSMYESQLSKGLMQHQVPPLVGQCHGADNTASRKWMGMGLPAE